MTSADLVKLEATKPYMLRKDGKLLSCGYIHPYIKYIVQNTDREEIFNLFSKARIKYLFWFYENTSVISTKQDIEELVSAVLNLKDYTIDSDVVEELRNKIHIVAEPLILLEDIEALYNELNDETNQEFCRVRTSDMKFNRGISGDVYFRISSTEFNWFNLIWKLVLDNKNFVESVSICTDAQATGRPVMWYKHNGKIINHMPVEDFLTLEGTPVIEGETLAGGKSLVEVFGNVHPYHIHQCFQKSINLYIKENFTLKSGSKELGEYLTMKDIAKQIENLKRGDVIRYRVDDVMDFDYVYVTREEDFPYYLAAWQEGGLGKHGRRFRYSNPLTIAEIIKDVITSSEPELVKSGHDEAMEEDFDDKQSVELEYDDLDIDVEEGPRDWETGERRSHKEPTSYVYEASRDEVEEELRDIVDPDLEMSDKDLDIYINNHFDELVNDHYDELKDIFREKAVERATYNESLRHSKTINIREALNKLDRETYGRYDLINMYEAYSLNNNKKKRLAEMLIKEAPVQKVYKFLSESYDEDYFEFDDYSDEDVEDGYEELASKTVYDSDGFTTDYTLYVDYDEHKYVCIFGDKDVYNPRNTSPDVEFDTFDQAKEWFDTYEGFEEREELEENKGLMFMGDEDNPAFVIPDKNNATKKVFKMISKGNREKTWFKPHNKQQQDIVNYVKDLQLKEASMSDLDIEIKEAGGRDAWISGATKVIDDLEKEMYFLRKQAPREVGRGGNFDSQEEIDRAYRDTYREYRNLKDALSIVLRDEE